MNELKPQKYGTMEIYSGSDEPAYSEDGVDLTLIRWMLRMTPAERLQVLNQSVNAIMRIRDANPHL